MIGIDMQLPQMGGFMKHCGGFCKGGTDESKRAENRIPFW